MSALLACGMLLAVGPELDPIEGAAVTAADRELLPSGRHVGSLADLWFVELVNMRPSGGGLALFDSPALSSHGRSLTGLRYFINDIEVSDPARSGAALVEVPHHAWQSTRYKSLWTAAPGFRWQLEPTGTDESATARGAWGREVGGPLLVPEGFMDREPALPFGATPVRRGMTHAAELQLDGHWPGGMAAIELIDHGHQYPTLRNAKDALIDDHAQRTTALVTVHEQVGALPLSALAIWQGRRRTHAGAELRHPEPLTLRESSSGAMAQLATDLAWRPDLTMRAALGFAWRSDTAEPRRNTPAVVDIEDEWLWQHRLRFGEELKRLRVDVAIEATLGEHQTTRLSLRSSHARISSRAAIPGGMVGTTYQRATQSDNRHLWLTTYDAPEWAREYLDTLRLEINATPRIHNLDVHLMGALDGTAARSQHGPTLSNISPALGLAVVGLVGDARLFALVRREPLPFTSELMCFVDPARPSSVRRVWLDDGDGVPEANEAGALLSRSGGDSHILDPHLGRPASNQLALGWRTPRFGPFRAILTGVWRVLQGRYTVVLAGDSAASFHQSTIGELYGGDLSGSNIRAEDIELPVYVREPGSEGLELYQLTNARRSNTYLGAEIQLLTDTDSWWFVNLGASGYWSLGSAPFGIFPDRNDPGIIDEVSADPNQRVNQWGSIDSGRAFSINLLAGVRPIEDLSIATALRYRDGQPMTRMIVVEPLPQGPTVLMAVPRGDPIPRFTFHMTVDLRMRYTLRYDGARLALVIDGFNLLGSGTELSEDIRSGSEYRRSLEMVPGRTVLLGLEAGWDAPRER